MQPGLSIRQRIQRDRSLTEPAAQSKSQARMPISPGLLAGTWLTGSRCPGTPGQASPAAHAHLHPIVCRVDSARQMIDESRPGSCTICRTAAHHHAARGRASRRQCQEGGHQRLAIRRLAQARKAAAQPEHPADIAEPAVPVAPWLIERAALGVAEGKTASTTLVAPRHFHGLEPDRPWPSKRKLQASGASPVPGSRRNVPLASAVISMRSRRVTTRSAPASRNSSSSPSRAMPSDAIPALRAA
jgi:hypothetical protein